MALINCGSHGDAMVVYESWRGARCPVCAEVQSASEVAAAAEDKANRPENENVALKSENDNLLEKLSQAQTAQK